MQAQHVHRGVRFTITAHELDRWTLAVQVDGLPLRPDDDNSYQTWEAARAAGIELARSIIDGMS